DDSYKKQEKKIEKIQKQIEDAIENQDYFSAAELKSQEEELKKELQKIRSNKNIPMNLRSVITPEDIGKVLADKTGIPTNIVNEDEITKLKRLDSDLKNQIIGQDEAVDSIVKTLIRSRLSVIRKNKPIGSFLFLGPSGVGKTYLAKLIAKTYFGDESAMIRFDMSEFMEKFSVSKLIGSPAGYVGYDEGGGLTEAVKRKPYAVVLLDEIEKASPDVLNILLQILDEGQLKDSKGRRVDFKNTIIIMTSNIGTEEFSKKKSSIGFDTGSSQDMENKLHEDIKTRVLEDLKNYLTPELSNRIDHKIVFRALTKKDLTDIFNQKLKTFLAARKTNEKVKLPKFTKTEIEKIIDKIYDPQFGARPVERYINDEIEAQIINSLLK
ncbi:ATP-dependent Clp protease ATP-binding subunit, partial [Candidatus Gracilibacteria bacterium]|nr:ATP-dependent Clp protease ATP-binding subunit [Candidatus Gracilibacteria bacterium]